jgi:hypothetical protein
MNRDAASTGSLLSLPESRRMASGTATTIPPPRSPRPFVPQGGSTLEADKNQVTWHFRRPQGVAIEAGVESAQ